MRTRHWDLGQQRPAHVALHPVIILLRGDPHAISTAAGCRSVSGPGRIVKNEASALGGKRKYVRRAGPGPGRRKQNSDGDSDVDVTPAIKKRKKRKVRSQDQVGMLGMHVRLTECSHACLSLDPGLEPPEKLHFMLSHPCCTVSKIVMHCALEHERAPLLRAV